MAYRVFFLNRLREGVAAANYENWVRTTDYPIVRRHPAVQRYDVTKIEATIDGKVAPSFDYLEVLEVTSIKEYHEALATSEFKQLLEEWSKYVSAEAVHGEVIE